MSAYLIECEFEYGGSGSFYQVILDGVVIGYKTLDGSDLRLPEPCGYRALRAIEDNSPAWFQPA